MKEHHITVQRTARYHTLGEMSDAVREVWFVCHGYRQLAGRFLQRFREIEAPHRLIIAPEALNRFYLDTAPGPHGPDARVGATWMTREDRLTEIRDYVHYLDTLYTHVFTRIERSVVRVHVLGFSQGVATVSRWATRGRAEVDRLILWAGILPPDLDRAAARDRLAALELVYVLGADDEYTTPARVREEQHELEALGISSRLVPHPGGHRVHADTLRRLAEE